MFVRFTQFVVLRGGCPHAGCSRGNRPGRTGPARSSRCQAAAAGRAVNAGPASRFHPPARTWHECARRVRRHRVPAGRLLPRQGGLHHDHDHGSTDDRHYGDDDRAGRRRGAGRLPGLLGCVPCRRRSDGPREPGARRPRDGRPASDRPEGVPRPQGRRRGHPGHSTSPPGSCRSSGTAPLCATATSTTPACTTPPPVPGRTRPAACAIS